MIRQIVFVLAALMGLIALSLPATGQDHLNPEDERYDHTFDGVHYRIPASYVLPGTTWEHLFFTFWISDGKPEGVGVPAMGTSGRAGRFYWPPEPGRPSFSSDDFLVNVREAVPMDATRGRAYVDHQRMRGPSSGGQVTSEGGLECRNYPTTAKYCYTRSNEDPDVAMDLRLWGAKPLDRVWEMTLYSKVDALLVKITFPGVGQSRWPEVVCRTLLFVRSWRVSDGAAALDCPLQRLAPAAQ